MLGIRVVFGLVLAVVVLAGLYVGGAWLQLYGKHEGPGQITATRIPETVVQARADAQAEVVRIRPQVTPGEPVAGLIEDPWRQLACEPGQAGCVVRFEDPDFVASGRAAVYYVRAIEEPSPAVNAGNLRCKYDEAGRCLEVRPCYGDYRTPASDDCLGTIEERAWSSPIYVDPA